jgi:hypothetical protein
MPSASCAQGTRVVEQKTLGRRKMIRECSGNFDVNKLEI